MVGDVDSRSNNRGCLCCTNKDAGRLPTALPQVCRTDTARPSRTPQFSSRNFLLRLPPATTAGLSSSCQAQGTASADFPGLFDPAVQLAVSLFAAPSVDAPAGPIIAGKWLQPAAAGNPFRPEQCLPSAETANAHALTDTAASNRCQLQQVQGLIIGWCAACWVF